MVDYQSSYANNARAFNGNIGSVSWSTMLTANQTQTPAQGYNYSYDMLNRLKKAAYTFAANSNFYNEELAYDVMGNIDSLRRTNGSTALYNNFKYTYSGNQLTKVTDTGVAKRTNSFKYNGNGSAMSNDSLKITNIEYNYLNLPKKFVKGTENLLYTYDANGTKLTKTLGTSVTQYVGGIQYKNGAIEFIQTEEGRILPNGSSFIYEYFLTDHLGNTRGIVDHTGALKQVQDYYAFGMEMNTGGGLNTASNQYKYNGKEKQTEFQLDQLDYGARFYDAEIGRWNVVDPLAQKFFSSSPYNYVDGNPITRVDPDGRAWFTRYVGEDGRTLLNTNDGSDDVVVVPWNRTNEFMESVEYSGRMLDDPSWNGNWKDELGVAISGDLLNSYGHNRLTDRGQAAAIEYLFGSREFGSFVLEEALGQWSDPTVALPAVVSAAGAGLGSFQTLSARLNAAKGGTQGGLNLFKWGAEQTTKSTGWKAGDYMLHLPNKGTPKLNWKANYGSLRREMGLGKPIFDSYRLSNGNLIQTGGFLNAERSILQGRGWIYNPSQGAWLPPIK